ncbi:hypothetical protein [Streptomyces sp. NPDC091294]|uniref:hypothetical protein n=1 Tax=Streptomyces sp. NPDC091294 TaxID=3365992 RepID=UPI003802916C
MNDTSSTSDPRELGVPRELVHETARALRNADTSLGAFLKNLATDFPAGAPAHQDDEFISKAHHKRRSPLRWIRSWNDWTTGLSLTNASDHVLAIQRVLEAGAPVSVWPCVSLSRVVTEGCARVCHVRDPKATSEERFARGAAAWLDSCQQHLTAARDFYPDRTLSEAEEAWKKAERKVTDAGIVIGLDRKGKPSRVTLGATTVNLSASLVDILRARPSHPPSWYRIASGASHNMTWLVQQAAAPSADGMTALRADPAVIIASALAVLGAYEDVTHTFGTYFGHEGTAAAVRTVQGRTLAVVALGKRWERQMEKDIR